MSSLAALGEQLRRERRLVIAVKVIPKSSRNEVVGFLDDGTLKIKVAAVPERGRANDELCRFLAEQFQVPQRSVSVIAGQTSHQKRIQIVMP